MRYHERDIQFENDFLIVPEHETAGGYQLRGDEEISLESPVWFKNEPHIRALIQTGPVDTTIPARAPEAREQQYDDFMVIDMRRVFSRATILHQQLFRPFCDLQLPPSSLFVVVHGLSFNHLTHVGYKTLRLGEYALFGSNTGSEMIDERFRHLSSATQPTHFEVGVTDQGDISVQNYAEGEGTFVYTGHHITERIQWSSKRLQSMYRSAWQNTMIKLLRPNS